MTGDKIRAANPEWAWSPEDRRLGKFRAIVGRGPGNDHDTMVVFHPDHQQHVDFRWPASEADIEIVTEQLSRAIAARPNRKGLPDEKQSRAE